MAIKIEAKPAAKKTAAPKKARKGKAKRKTTRKTARKPATPKVTTKPEPKKEAHSTPEQKREHKGGATPKLSDVGLVIEVLRASGGIKAVAAQRLKVSRTTLYKYIEENPEIGDALREIDGELGDIAEAKIVSAIRAGDMQTVRWYAEMKMKDRGYVRRVENVGKDGGPIETQQKQDLSGYTDEELQKMLAIQEAREAREKKPGGK